VIPERIATILVVYLFAACAGSAPAPESCYPDAESIKALPDCPADRIPVCLEQLGRPYRCFCGDRDALQEVLEPDNRPR
jgi:hypothetical protein